MKSLATLTFWIFILLLVPISPSIGQEKKSEQRIKIVIADDDGNKTVLDTVIAGTPGRDTIILRDGNRILIKGEENDSGRNGTTKVYTVTTTSQENDGKKEIRKEVTVIGSGSDENKDSEKTKYVIKREGMTVTVEGSDYEKVKELVRGIESYLEMKDQAKQHSE
jgi:hypothetical protein